MLKLENNVKVYIPLVKNLHEISNIITRDMTKEFGGVTLYSSKGFWLDDNDIMIEDTINVAISFTDKSIEEIKRIISKYVEIIKMDLKQDAVSIEINNILYII